MKKIIYIKSLATAIITLLCFQQAQAQLSGSYTIGGTSPDYSTLSAAVSALNSQGVNGPVVFNIRDGSYSGTTAIGSIGNITGASATNTITFQSQSGNRANCILTNSGGSTTNYIFELNNARYITIKNLTLSNTNTTFGCDVRFAGSASYNTIQNCVLTGSTATSTSNNMSRIFGTGLGSASNNTFKGNLIDRGAYGVYFYGSGTSTTTNDNVFEDNQFNENYFYGMYGFYNGDITVKNNTFTRNGSGTYYAMYFYYTANNFYVTDNIFNLNTTSTTYATMLYYTNYYTQNKDAGLHLTGNVYNMTSTTNSIYPTYHYYSYYSDYSNNTFNINSNSTSGYIYDYLMYYNQYCIAENNTWNITKAGGYIYLRPLYYGANDTFRNNVINEQGNAFTYNYFPYYCQGYVVTGNEVSLKTNTTTAYGAYVYQYSGIFANNKINCESTSGAMYGMYLYYQQGSKIFNNTIRVQSGGTCYGVNAYYNYTPTRFFNNTIYNEGTSSSSYGMYLFHSSASYDIDVLNNIIYKTSSNGYCIYNYYPDYAHTDYNLYYKPGGSYFYSISPNNTSDNLQDWRKFKGDDMNSLIYQVPFNDASNGDFSIDASSTAAWAVNGRGVHDTTATTDIAGNPRAGVVTAGVPDLGAYEVVPTSIPPYADATPTNPVANSTQVFTFGQDTVGTINWGSTVPSSFQMRQYTGTQAAPMPMGVGRMYFYTTATTSDWTHKHIPNIRYKNPWIGDVSSEQNAVIARSSNGGIWEGYNYTNANTNTTLNILSPTNQFDSVGAYTGVENGRIGIRCVESPKGISITNITAFTADIAWDPVFNPIGYQIILKKNPATPTDADWTNSSLATTNAHSAIGLDEDSTYYLFIRSICGLKDTSGYSMDSFTTLITCHTPDVQLTAQNDSRVIAYWGQIKTAYKYEYALTKSQTPPSFGTDITKTSVLENYLNDGTDYWVHVKAHCGSIYPTSQWETVPFKTWATNVANINTEGEGLSVYPNPVREELGITIGGSVNGTGTVMLLDMTGKVLKAATMNGKQLSMNVSELASGSYILQYMNDDRREQIKFNKQ